MEIENRINTIEAELQQTKYELKNILSDIRAHLSLREIPNPIPNDPNKEKSQEELKTKRG